MLLFIMLLLCIDDVSVYSWAYMIPKVTPIALCSIWF